MWQGSCQRDGFEGFGGEAAQGGFVLYSAEGSVVFRAPYSDRIPKDNAKMVIMSVDAYAKTQKMLALNRMVATMSSKNEH